MASTLGLPSYRPLPPRSLFALRLLSPCHTAGKALPPGADPNTDAVVVLARNNLVFALDPASGELLWW